MDNTLTLLKNNFIEYKMHFGYTEVAEESLKRERAEIEFNTLLEKIKHPDFEKRGEWEEYIPEWLEGIWPFLKDSAKILIYIMARECKSSYDEGREEAFNECGN